MAGRIVRKPNSIVVVGAPTSAAASQAGSEKAPHSLRAAGLTDQLRAAGFDVTDLGDCAAFTFQPDEENPRARNLRNILQAVESLRPLVEQAVKTGGLPLILGGDCSIALASLAGLRRYHRNLGLFYMDRDADLNVPATSPSGFIEGMVVAHVAGRGAAELLRFWGEPPLVREPETVLFGVGRLDAPEEERLRHSSFRYFPADTLSHQPPADSTQMALEKIHGQQHEFLLHLDVDVIAENEMPAVDHPGSGGLNLVYVRDVLGILVRQPRLAAIEIASYNPEKDADGRAAETIITLLVDALVGMRGNAKEGESAGASSGARPDLATVASAASSLHPAARASESSPETSGIEPLPERGQHGVQSRPSEQRETLSSDMDEVLRELGGEG